MICLRFLLSTDPPRCAMSDSDSDSDSGAAPRPTAAASSAASAAASHPNSTLTDEQRAERKAGRAAAKAAKKAARPPPEVHLKNVPMLLVKRAMQTHTPPAVESISFIVICCVVCSLVTCDGGKEALAKKEMLSWLQEYADRVYPRESQSDVAAKGATSVSGGLAAELAALQAESAASRASSSSSSAAAAASLGVRFKLVGDMAIFRGLFLIAVLDPAVPIVSMVEGMLAELRATRVFKTRYCVHLHPFMQTCYSEMDGLFKMARSIVPAEFERIAATQPADQRKYCVDLVRRGHHNQMDRMAIIHEVAKLVPVAADTPGGPFSVDLKHAHIVVLVEILGRTTGISVLTRYNELCKMSIRGIFEQVTGTKQEDEAKQAPPGEGKNAIKRKMLQQQKEAQAAAAQATGAEPTPSVVATAKDTPAEQQASSKKQRTTKNAGDAS